MTELSRYEVAERAIAAAEAVDEVLEIRSQAEAWRAYAKQAKNRDLEIKAARIRFRAERRLGEMLLASDRAKGGRPGDKTCSDPERVFEAPPTLAEAGIDRKLSSRAQRLAAMDRAEFERALERQAEEMRAGQGRVAMDLLKVGAEEKGRAHRRNVAAVLSEQSAALPSGPMVPAVYLDPPWRRQGGIGDRAYENHYPTMTWPEILAYLRQVAPRLLPDSWAFMWIPRPHLLALVEIELEVTIAATGEVAPALVDMPLAWGCAKALEMDSYSTCFVWTKTDDDHPDESGSGLIAFDQDELLLLFKRGRGLPKPSGEEKFGSNHRERSRPLGHSRKPEHYRHMITTMVGCDAEGRPLPVLELFARVDAEHPLPPGWIAAGNQAEIDNATDAAPSSARDCDHDARRDAWRAYQDAQDSARLWQHPAIADLHVLKMTRDYAGEVSFDVATCQCGWSFRCESAPFDLARDWACDAHWREVIESFAAGLPSDAGETVTAAADATENGASPAAAVADVVSAIGEVGDRAPYDDGDVIQIDQLAGSDYLQSAELDALELEEIEQLRILSDFCHPKRDATQDVLGPHWQAREMAYLSGGQWQLREAGRARLRTLIDAAAPPARVELTEPYRSPQPSLFDCPAPEIVDGVLQTRLPVDDDELAEQLALMAVDAGGTIDGEMGAASMRQGLPACDDKGAQDHSDRPRVSRAAGRACIRSTAARGSVAMSARGGWIQTAMGRQFWPMDPRPNEVFIDDIAHALSLLCRFGGHCLRFYSVAEHCVLLSRIAPEPYKLWALMHDASEAYLVDVPRPLKPFLGGYDEAEDKIMQAIAFRFHLHLGMPDQVKRLDRAILMDERLQNMAEAPIAWSTDCEPLGVALQFWSPEQSRAEFLAAFEALGGRA